MIKRSNRQTHGMSGTKINWIWSAMLQRCNNPKNKYFCQYGGRGIKVCERWLKFENFFADMGEQPFPRAMLERVDNSKGYEPSNVIWADGKIQMRNTRRTKNITYNGKTMCVKDWAAQLGLHWRTLHWRLSKMSVEEAFTRPIVKIRNKKGQYAFIEDSNYRAAL